MVSRCLKGVAVALIFLPEPVTTVLGIAMLSFLLVLSKPKKLSDLGDLESLINRSLRDTVLSESCLYFLKKQTPVFHALKGSAPQQPITIIYQAVPHKLQDRKRVMRGKQNPELDNSQVHALKKYIPSSEGTNGFDNRKVPETVLHHTLRTSLPQYEADSSAISALKQIAVKEKSEFKLHTLAKTSR